jgi:hypothetical protein
MTRIFAIAAIAALAAASPAAAQWGGHEHGGDRGGRSGWEGHHSGWEGHGWHGGGGLGWGHHRRCWWTPWGERRCRW